ncbi:hypothetical protein APHAL10511_005770 [Amanita phalloides]|nr:hypothetical protein APHAL10511_005770 [Amanita phalloides]
MSDVVTEKHQCKPTEKAHIQAEDGLQQCKCKAVDHAEGSLSSEKHKKSGPTAQEKAVDHEEGSLKKQKKSGPSAQEPATIDINSLDDEALFPRKSNR